MLSSDETKTGGKPRVRKAKPAQDGKAKSRQRKGAAPVPAVDQAAPEETEPVASAETAVATVVNEIATTVPETAALPSPAETSPVVPAASEESAPVSYRAFADAWGEYSRTSLEQIKAYFEKLAGVRSLGAVFEVQAEFARQACEAFVAQSQRIAELQGELARQRLQRLESFMAKMTPVTRS